MNTSIKTPEEIKQMQKSYTHQVESMVVDSLTEQFNTLISQEGYGKSIYTITMFMYRPAGYYSTLNIKNRFITRCTSAGWLVRSAVINECQFTVTVSPLIT